jgi:hypothetical integral membrane protein (TIGR02206 family)
VRGTASNSHFQLFGPVHLLILGAVPVIALLLAQASKRSRASSNAIRYALATFLAVNEFVWDAYNLHFGGFRFPGGLPLQLCDATLWVTVLALFTLNPLAFEIAYFGGLGGAGMALLTPDLWAPLASYPSIYFFVAHGLVVACPLMLLWSRQARPRPGAPWRMFAALNVYAVAVGIFNAIFKTNYMYLCNKPASASILDLFGPWPLYLLPGEAVALVIFWLLWLPVRQYRQPEAAYSSALGR